MKLGRKIITAFSIFSILIQSISPLTYTVPSAFAQEVTPTPTQEPSPPPDSGPTDTPSPTPTPTEIVTPTPADIVTPTPQPTEAVTPTPEITPVPTEISPTPTTPAENIPTQNPTENTSQPNAPPETPAPNTPTPEVSPTLTVSPQANITGNEHVDIAILKNVSAPSIDLESAQSEGSASLITDKADYAPTDTVVISGTGFLANTSYTLEITSNDPPAVDFKTEVTTNEQGSFIYAYQLDGNYRPNYKVEAKDSAGNIVATVTFTDTNPSADLDQCANDSASSPDSPCVWQNGNLNSNQAHYVEGYSVPYRAVLSDLPTGSPITITFGYDIKHSGAHAIDYLTYYNRLEPHSPFGHSAETINPTSGVSGISGTTTTFTFPTPDITNTPVSGQPATSFNSLPAGEKLMTLYGGILSNIAYNINGDLTANQSETTIDVTFTPDSAKAVLAWGGHIAREADWGPGNSAGGINGSPYHMRLKGWSIGNLGQQDRSLQAGAVAPPSSIIIIKDAQPNDTQDFAFTTTGNGLSSFTLDDDGGSDSTYSNTTTFSSLLAGTYTVTEATASGWTLASKTCQSDGTGSTSQQITDGVSISLVAGENLTCTFTNTLQQAHLNVIKHVINDNGGTAIASNFTMAVSGTNVSSPSFPGAELPGTDVTLDAGSYNVTESGPTGYSASYSTDCTGTIVAGQTKICTITNDDIAPTLKLVKEVTNDDRGQANPVDWILNARTLCVFGDTSLACGFSDNGDSTTFHPLAAGKVYNLWESGPSGYTMGSWSCNGGSLNGNRLTLGLDEEVTCTITNDDQPGSISGLKFEDKNGNGVKDAEDSGLSNWTINLNGPINTSITTDSNGNYTFPDLPAGTYTVTETLESGWTQTTANPDPINLANGQSVDEINFGNFELGSVSGEKFEDLDGDELAQEEGEPLLSGWTIRLYDITTTPWALVDTDVTDDSGEYSFTNLEPGNYRACEVLQSGWTQLFPNINNNNNSPSSSEEGPRCQTVNIDNSGESNTRNFGNFKRGLITIIKNTIGGDDTFTYEVMPTEEIFQIQTVGNTGDKVFGDLSAGEYVVTERELVGWDLTGLTCSAGGAVDIGNKMATITITSGADVICTFTNTQRGTISGTKYEVNSDSSVVDVLSGWIIYLFSGDLPIDQTNTDPIGNYFFGNLVFGTYSLLEDLLGGWTQIFGPSEVNLNPGDSSTDNNFGNFQNGSIQGVKFNDLNGNGEMDCKDDSNGFCEFGLEEWTIFIDENENGVLDGEEQSQETDEDGYYSFTNLEPGSYTVCEEEQTGWNRTKPAGSNCETVEITNSGQTSTVDFGNQGRGTITVHKNVDNNGDGQLDEENVTDWTWDVDGEGDFATGDESQGVAVGSYTVSEDQKDNYHVSAV